MLSLTPARLAHTEDGTPYSDTYADIYHSADGGAGQARHVFLQGNALPQRWAERERFVILETGFGSGLNFLATWAAWRQDPDRCGRLHYLAVEKHPFHADDLARMHARWPQYVALSTLLCGNWPTLTPGFHRLEFDAGRVILSLLLGEAETVLRACEAEVDAFYLDGFDPKKNPDMWSPTLMRRLARLASAEATLATWCVAREVRAALSAAGFSVEKQPGYGRKRHMLRGNLLARRAVGATGRREGERQAVVLGAGLAGCALSERLAARGWSISLVERHASPASEASGNLAGIVRPMLSRDDNRASRFSRACFLHARRAWAALADAGHDSLRALDGVLQIACDAAQEEQMRDIAASGLYPAEYLRYLDQTALGSALGYPALHGGWLFPGGGWANPPSLCRAMLAAAGDHCTRIHGREAAQILQVDGNWRLLDAHGQPIAEAPILILAGGAQSGRLAAQLPIHPVRGQVSHIPQGQLPAFNLPACCEGYLTPAVAGFHCLGASYVHDDDNAIRLEEHTGNLQRLAHILPSVEQMIDLTGLGGRVGFRATTPDRLPLVGALAKPNVDLPRDYRFKTLPRQDGLYVLLGLGSRGLVWASLAAEILASRITGDPLPVETELVEAIDPARFILRAHRRGLK